METPATFGRYEVIERVGRGGMGMLYRGKDPVLDREVAIKVMSGDFSADEGARARFFREARAAARLQHRNIVTIFEFAEDEHGTPYIAMEFLRGRSLAARLTVEPALSLVQKLDILTQLCTGLHYAHEQGIVHRDVKPANIWVMDDGTIKLLDFGIAKIAASTMTSSGNVLGSAAYMAPEQVSGREIDGRADVFASGVVLYELLARRKPFEGDAPTAVMMKIIKEDPPPIRNFAPDIPVSLVNAVNKALQKDPDKRFMHAGDFGSELRLIRLALERTSETLKAENVESSSDTVYVPDAHDGSAAAGDDCCDEIVRGPRARCKPRRCESASRPDRAPRCGRQPVHHVGCARSRGGRGGAGDDHHDAAPVRAGRRCRDIGFRPRPGRQHRVDERRHGQARVGPGRCGRHDQRQPDRPHHAGRNRGQ